VSMPSATELEAYLDEALPPADMARIESALRADAGLARRLTAIVSRRDAGLHSLGAIWRRHRLSCPDREKLGSYLLDALSDEERHYIRFHIEVVGCRQCQANLADLGERLRQQPAAVEHRRRRFFQTSAGLLRKH